MRLNKTILKDKLFRALPGCYLILNTDADFTILDVNDAYLEVTDTNRGIIGQPLFTIFPDNPNDPKATGVKNLTASLNKVIKTKRKHKMSLQRYDTRIAGTSHFEIRYWSPLNIPVLDNDGSLQCIIHSVKDVTDAVVLKQHLEMHDHNTQQQITNAISTTQELERMEISRELHDNINQILVTSRMYLGRAMNGHTVKKELVQPGYELLEKAINEIKKISLSLLKTTLEEETLVAAINNILNHVRSFGAINIQKEIRLPDEKSFSPKFRVALFRIVQEAVANVIKHAEAKNLMVQLVVANHVLTLTIKDDGKGFRTSAVKNGMGFQSMKSRVAMIDGTLQIASKPGKGCTIVVKVPVQNGDAE